MHKKLLNEATLYLTIKAQGPLLIKAGAESDDYDPTRPDMAFVRTHHARLGATIFLPGSSLKGTLRSYGEKIAHTLGVHCCDPFHKKHSCSTSQQMKDWGTQNNGPELYKNSCVACQVYGSTNLAGRALFADAYPSEAALTTQHLTTRTAVAIDRVLGSVAVGPFNFEALVEGEFATRITLRNFELWQLGWFGLAVRDFCLGRVRLGYGKSRGFGGVAATLDQLELRSWADDGLTKTGEQLAIKGIGGLLSQDERQSYGISGAAETQPLRLVTTAVPDDELLGSGIVFTRNPADGWCAPEVMALLRGCVGAWREYVAGHPQRGGHGN